MNSVIDQDMLRIEGGIKVVNANHVFVDLEPIKMQYYFLRLHEITGGHKVGLKPQQIKP